MEFNSKKDWRIEMNLTWLWVKIQKWLKKKKQTKVKENDYSSDFKFNR